MTDIDSYITTALTDQSRSEKSRSDQIRSDQTHSDTDRCRLRLRDSNTDR